MPSFRFGMYLSQMRSVDVPALTGMVRERDLALQLGLTVWALRAWRKRGYGPPYGKVGRTVVYRISDVHEFIECRMAPND